MTVWATKAQARAHWADAIPLDDAVLDTLLFTSTRQCREYAPASKWRTLTDAATTSGSSTLTSALGAFTYKDEGMLALGAGIPLATYISAVAAPVAPDTSVTTATMSATASATATGVQVLLLPMNFMLATVYQARENYAASQRGEQDVIGVGDYAIRARPLTAAVKQLLRPQSGVPAVG